MHALTIVLSILAADGCEDRRLGDAVVAIAVEKDKRSHIERSFIGPGIALADGAVLAPLTIFRDEVPSKVFVDGAQVRVANIDRIRGLVLLKAPSAFPRPATIAAPGERPGDGAQVRVAGYIDTRSEPRLFEKIALDGKVTRSKFGGVSPDGLDLGDLMAVHTGDDRLIKRGAGVYSKKTCALLGLSIGEVRGGDLMVVPSEVIALFLRSPGTRASAE